MKLNLKPITKDTEDSQKLRNIYTFKCLKIKEETSKEIRKYCKLWKKKKWNATQKKFVVCS